MSRRALGENRLAPLALTITRLGSDRFAAMFNDTTSRRQSDEELRNAKREAAKAAAAKTEFMTEFLAKVSHEIRTPLNAITGFAEVIMAERFGPIGNERYREYVKDIHAAGTHLVAMLNDLVDLSRIESGKADAQFRQYQPQRAHPAMRRHHAAAGQQGAHHHPHRAHAGFAAGRRRRALDAPDRAQSACRIRSGSPVRAAK